MDASVILHAMLPSGNQEIFLRFQNHLRHAQKGEITLSSIPLLVSEFANGVRFALTDSMLAAETFKKFSLLPIKYFALSAEQVSEALALSYELGTTVYDTSYHLLARLLSATFITADREYFQKAKVLGNIDLW